jgi:hypothetical protein
MPVKSLHEHPPSASLLQMKANDATGLNSPSLLTDDAITDYEASSDSSEL